MTTILETEYVEQTRPYSLNELGYMREQLYKRIKLGKVRSIHEKCGHFYLVKKNGRRLDIVRCVGNLIKLLNI
jgi:hypothetical protein